VSHNRRSFLKTAATAFACPAAGGAAPSASAVGNGAVRATSFESRTVYHARQNPGYACWVSFFPGENGAWYLTCEEVTRLASPNPRMSREQFYAFALPEGYDKAPFLMEIVLLESRDDMKTWQVISRQPVRYQHSAGSFGQSRTPDGRFLRFLWETYSLEPGANPGRILSVSEDGGRTWMKQPPFHDARFCSYPHRLRTLRDGTLVLALPMYPAWGPGTDFPTRICRDPRAVSSGGMHLVFSHDAGRTWTIPMPIYAGRPVTETDFVELPSGDLLCVNNSIYPEPGRQIIYRTKQGFLPGPFERSDSAVVPETICITESGVLVGCLRNSRYLWSDDLGHTWFPLEGIPEAILHGRETYQPWIQYLGGNRFANAGHFGGDNRVGEFDQYVMIHFFEIAVRRATKNTHLELTREFDEAASRWRNSYVLRLTCDGQPLAGKEIEFWFAQSGKPGYDDVGRHTLAERMSAGGETIRVTSSKDGLARISLPALDANQSIHHSIQLVARFNADRRDPDYKPAMTPEFEFYTNLHY
jgi:hypothetical protein